MPGQFPTDIVTLLVLSVAFCADCPQQCAHWLCQFFAFLCANCLLSCKRPWPTFRTEPVQLSTRKSLMNFPTSVLAGRGRERAAVSAVAPHANCTITAVRTCKQGLLSVLSLFCILSQAGVVLLSRPDAALSCRKAIESKRNMLESLQKRCSAAQSKLEGEYGHLGSLEAKTKELEHLRKVLRHAATRMQQRSCADHFVPHGLHCHAASWVGQKSCDWSFVLAGCLSRWLSAPVAVHPDHE